MRLKSLLLTCVAVLAVATPAAAAWDFIGSVDIGYRRDHDAKALDLGGPVDRLLFGATGSDIDCRAVRAEFGNGNSRRIFRGRIQRGQDRDIDLPGEFRSVRRLTFDCGATRHRGGTIRISADVGQHREEWQRNPDFQAKWSRLFNWGAALLNPNAQGRWDLISTESFEGRSDKETSVTGWQGRHVDTVALKPLDADVRCRRISALFGNGNSRDIDLAQDRFIRRGEFRQLDIPGENRNLQSLSLECRATNASRASVQVFLGR